MKNYLFTLFLSLLSFGLNYSQDFKEIYNFNIGDVFQYSETGNDGEGDIYFYEITENYKIIDKLTSGDTLKYYFSGKHFYYSYYYNFGNKVELNKWVSDVNDSLILIDSANNNLNKPIGTLLLLTPPYSSDSVYTRILEDTTLLIPNKVIGGSVHDINSNLFVYKSDTSELDTINWDNNPIFTTTYKQVFVKGLGLYEEDYQGFEYWHLKSLVGYIKNDDTTGTITPDSWFTGYKDVIQNDLSICQNPVRDYFLLKNIDISERVWVKIYNLNGQLLINTLYTSQLYVGNLEKGVYFAKVETNNKNKIFKIVKD